MTHKLLLPTLALIASAAMLAGCGDDAGPTPTEAAAVDEVVLVTHDSFAIPDDVLAAFEADSGVAVRVLRSGDAGATINQAILTKDNPIGDVLFGVDNTFLSRALDAGIFRAYKSPALESVPVELQLDDANRVTPIDVGNVCLNYDRAAFGEDQVAVPASLDQLTDPAYAGMLVVQDPTTSSPGLAFLLATIAAFGEEGDYTWQSYWRELVANDVLVTSGWEEAYNGSFSGGSGQGDRPLVVSYASSPPAEVIFSDPQPTEAPTGVITDGCFQQIEFAGILEGSAAGKAAEALIDFMLSATFQEAIPLNMFVYPANAEAELPPEFVEYTTLPEAPRTLDPAIIDANRERWLREWIELVR
jgi:thiamine transport system substrate-binding protein